MQKDRKTGRRAVRAGRKRYTNILAMKRSVCQLLNRESEQTHNTKKAEVTNILAIKYWPATLRKPC